MRTLHKCVHFKHTETTEINKHSIFHDFMTRQSVNILCSGWNWKKSVQRKRLIDWRDIMKMSLISQIIEFKLKIIQRAKLIYFISKYSIELNNNSQIWIIIQKCVNIIFECIDYIRIPHYIQMCVNDVDQIWIKLVFVFKKRYILSVYVLNFLRSIKISCTRLVIIHFSASLHSRLSISLKLLVLPWK